MESLSLQSAIKIIRNVTHARSWRAVAKKAFPCALRLLDKKLPWNIKSLLFLKAAADLSVYLEEEEECLQNESLKV